MDPAVMIELTALFFKGTLILGGIYAAWGLYIIYKAFGRDF